MTDEILKELEGHGFELRRDDALMLATHGMIYDLDTDKDWEG